MKPFRTLSFMKYSYMWRVFKKNANTAFTTSKYEQTPVAPYLTPLASKAIKFREKTGLWFNKKAAERQWQCSIIRRAIMLAAAVWGFKRANEVLTLCHPFMGHFLRLSRKPSCLSGSCMLAGTPLSPSTISQLSWRETQEQYCMS